MRCGLLSKSKVGTATQQGESVKREGVWKVFSYLKIEPKMALGPSGFIRKYKLGLAIH